MQGEDVVELLKQAVKRRGLNIEVQLCDNPSPSHKIIFYYIDNPSPSHLHTILNPQASTPPNHAVEQNRRWWRSWTTQQAAWCRPPGASPGAQLDSTVADFYIQNIFSGARLVSTLAHFQIQKIFSGAGLGWYLGPALMHATSKISKWFSPKSNLVSWPHLSWNASLL